MVFSFTASRWPRGRAGRLTRLWMRLVGLLALLALARLAPAQNITRVEYFLDADPGFGQATALPIATPTADVSGLSAAVGLSGLSTGFHQLGVRSQDANGTWSLTSRRTFYYEPLASAAPATITKAEYFIDAEPGFGNGVDIPLTAAADVSGLAFGVNLSGLATGFHYLSVRSKDATGKWSLTSVRSFYYETNALTAAPNVVKLEYFLDAEPGFGNGIDLPLTASPDVSNVGATVSLAGLSAGFHSLHVRSKDANGKWSLTSVRSFYYEPLLAAAPDVNKIEYFFDNDPGLGSGTDVPVTAAQDLPNVAFAADASGLADGAHRISVRSRDANGKWSLVWSRAFYKNGCASSENVAAGLPSASYSVLSAYNSNMAELVFNGRGYWQGGTPSYAQVLFGAARNISQVLLKHRNGGTGTIQIQTTTNGTTWTVSDTQTGTLAGGTTQLRTVSVAGITGLRVVFPTWSGPVPSLDAVEVYNFNCAGPNVISFTPASGAGGTSIGITGTNLTGATAVTFNGIAATSFTVNSATSITAIAPAGGSTGQICVTTPAGTACSSTQYFYPPTIATGTVSPAAFCSSTRILVPFTTIPGAYNAANQFYFQLSDANGVFDPNGRLYQGSVSMTANGGTLLDSVALRTPAGTGYRVRVVATSPATVGTDNGMNLTIYPTPPATATAAQTTVAYNGTIQLTAGPAAQNSYQWYVRYNNGGTATLGNTQQLTISNALPAQSGRYYVYVGNGSGCQDSASVRVLVQLTAQPIITVSQFNFSGCAGRTLNVGFTVTGNSFGSGNTMLSQLSDANGSFANPTLLGSLTYVGQGSSSVTSFIPTNTLSGTGYRIRVVSTNPAVVSQNDNGTDLTITQLPTAVASSNSPVPYGGTIQLTAQPVAGATYQWVGPGFASTQQNPTIPNATQAANQGTYSLHVTVGNCQSLAATTQVTVQPSTNPILSVAQFGGSFCGGTALSVGFAVTGNSFGSGNVLTAQLSDASGSFASPTSVGTVGFSGQGNGSIAVTLPNGSGAGYRLRLVGSNPTITSINDNGTDLTINPVPTAVIASNNSPVASGGTVTLTAQAVSGATYVWNVPGFGTVSTGSSPTLNFNNATASNSGTYVLSVTLGSCSATTTASVTVQPAPAVAIVTTGSFGGAFCPGSALVVPFTAAGFGSGNVFTAQLSDASGSFAAPVSIGTASGTGSGSIGAYIPASTTAGAGYRIRVVGSAPATVSSTDNGTDLTVQAVGYTWTGGVSTDWFDARNWSCGQVPTSSSNVVIGIGTYYPVVVGAGAVVNNLTVVSGATFQISSGFTIYGNVVSNGTWVGGGSYVFAGNGTQTVGGTTAVYFGGVTINSTATLSLNTGIYVAGNWVNNGGFVGGSYFVNFNGTAAQYIGGAVVTNFYHVVVSNLVALSLQQNIYVLGNWTNNGAFVAGSYGTTFGGTVAQVIGGSSSTNFGGLTILNTTGVTLSTGIGVAGVFVNNGVFMVGTNVVTFNGTVAQTIGGSSQTTFYSVVINNTVGVTLVSNIYVLGDWLNNGQFGAGSYTVIFAGTAAQLIGGSVTTNFYNVTFQNPVSVTLRQHIYVLGSFVNTGVFYGYYVAGGVTTGYFVRFGGTVAQVVNTNATTYFYHFYVDNAAGVSLASNVYIAGNYYLYSGSFAPAGYVVYFNGTGGLVQTVGGYTSLSFHGWNIVAGASVRLLQNVTLTGSFANAGIFYGYDLAGSVYTGYTFGWGGAAAQVLSGPGTFNFWHVTWNNAVGVTLQQNIYVLGNWLHSGGFVANGYTVFFNGTVAQLIGGTTATVFHHVSIGNTLSVSLNQAITVLGNWLGAGVFLGNGYLTYFNGTAAQTITAGVNTRFHDVRFNNAVSVTLLSDIYLNGNWTHDGGFVANGYAVYFTGAALQTIGGSVNTLFHHLTIAPNASVQLARLVSLTGNWTNGGTFVAAGYNVRFAGTAAQIIGGAVSTPFFGVIIDNTLSVTLAQDIRVRGGWVNNGVFVPATYTVYFDGTAAQLIGGTAATSFYHLTVLNTVGLSLSGPIFIAGNLVNNGLFSCANYLVTFNGTAAQTIGGTSVTVFGGVTFNNAVGVSLLQDIRVRGDLRNLAVFAAGGRVVYFDGTVAQGIYCPTGTLTFHDVTFANAAGVTLYYDIFVTGLWVNNGGFAHGGRLVTFRGTVLQTIGGAVATTFHHFAIASGATVRPLYNLTILGDWTNGGTWQHNSLLVTFGGTAAQTLGGTALTAFYDVTFNNPVNVSLGYDIDVVHHFVNSGGYCGCGYRTRFNGTAPQTITCTSGRTHFHDLTFANAAGVTLLDGIYVSGRWVNDGGYIANNQLVVFDGTALQTIAGTTLTSFWNVRITNLVNVQLLRDIAVGGYWLNNGIFSGNGYLTTFNGPASQLIATSGAGSKTTFHHVTWANLVGCVLAGDVYVTGNWLCNGPFDPATYTVYFNGTVAQTCGGSATLRFYGLNVSNPVGLTCNGAVYLAGNFANTGLVNCGLYAWYCVGSTAQTIGGVSTTPTRFYDLYIQNASGVTATDNWFVTHLLTLPSGNLASNGHLTLTSTATGTAMVVNPAGGGVVTGQATMERFITGVGAPGYRHYSSPMQLGTATAQEFADDLPVFELNPAYNTVGNSVSPFPTLFKYDETRLTASANFFDQGWMVPLASDNLLPGQGYSAQTDPTTVVDISGTLNNGAVSFSLTCGGQANSGWHLLGNPYPAPIDWDLVPAAAGLDKALYTHKPTGKYTGTYSSYINGIGQNGGTKDLAAMQGFFVRASAPTATFSLTNAVRATSYLSPGFLRPAAETRPLLRLEARNAQGLADETVLYFEQGAGAGYVAGRDAYKLQRNAGGRPTVWSQAGPEQLSINGLESLATAGVVPLGVRVSVAGAHTLVLTRQLNLPAGTVVALEDRLLGKRQNLALDSVYSFTSHPDSVRQRFYLWLRPATALAITPGTAASLSSALYPNPTATGLATLEVAGLQAQAPVRAEVLDAVGRVVLSLSLPVRQGSISEKLDLHALSTGVYLLRLHPQEGTLMKRLTKE